MFNKNDPLINSVKLVMEKNELERSVEKALNEAMGIVSMGALPHEKHAMYKELYKDILAEATFETNLQELSAAKIGSYMKKADDDARQLSRKTVVGGTPEEKKKFYAKIDKKVDKRLDGITLATKKLAGSAKVDASYDNETTSTSKGWTAGDLLNRTKKGNGEKKGYGAVPRNAGDLLKLKKEETQLDELSKDKKNSYITAALDDIKYQRRTQADAILKGKNDTAKKSGLKIHNRREGINRAVSEETLNELSKKTLGSYIKKASSNLDMNSHKAALNYAASKRIGDVADQKAVWQDKETIKRRKGIDRAADKLAKEETQLDEISKWKANAYLGSAVADLARSGQEHGRDYNKKKQTPEMQKNKRNVGNRQDGIRRAIQTLNKEETEQLDEISKNALHSYVKKSQASRDSNAANGDYDKARKRQSGINTAVKKLAKEETLNELSKKTLGSYIKKAKIELGNKAYLSGHDASSGSDPRNSEYEQRVSNNSSKKLSKIVKKRDKGIDTAADKLSGNARIIGTSMEEETLNELSKKTLGSYIKKATNDATYHSFEAGRSSEAGDHKNSLKSDKKAFSRQAGVEKATDKLVKEGMSKDELRALIAKSSSGKIKYVTFVSI